MSVPKLTNESRATPARRRVIRASEIGEYIYCHRAWWLGRVQGVENQNRAAMDAGTARHAAHGRDVARAFLFQRAAWVMLLIALGLGVALVVIANAR